MNETTIIKGNGSETTSLTRFSTNEVKDQVQAIQELMASVMKDGEHFGVIPSCGNKPALLKAGAEKINFMFRLAARIEGERNPIDLGNRHREYIIKTTLVHIPSGQIVGEGVGSASTLETKWRFRNKKTFVSNRLPEDYQTNKAAYKAEGFVAEKNEAGWNWFKVDKVENEPADQYNTVLKMAKKRSLVDATLTSTAASDFFTQDIEEIQHEEEHKKPVVNNKSEAASGEPSSVPPPYSDPEPRRSSSRPQSNGTKDQTADALAEFNSGGQWNQKYYNGDTVVYINKKKFTVNKAEFESLINKSKLTEVRVEVKPEEDDDLPF